MQKREKVMLNRYETVEVTSSSIKKIIWDNEKNLLLVQFLESPLYVYSNVPKSVFKDFVKAESKGKFFMAHIKKSYTFIRLDN